MEQAMRPDRRAGALASLALILVVVSLPATGASPTDDLRQSIVDVVRIQDTINKGNLLVDLAPAIAALTRSIESGQLNPVGLSVAHFYRGTAASLSSLVLSKMNRPPDVALARTAKADFDRVIAMGIDVPEVRVTVADAMYVAGVVLRNDLDSVPEAYSYWEKCAERSHAGCMNIMASAALIGEAGVKVDLARSLDLHRKVYETGTSYTCAGAYSALAASWIVYFGDMRGLAVTDLDWLKRAGLLLDEVSKMLGTNNPCDRVRFEISEYLIRSSRGDAERSMLESALKRADTPEEKAVADYLLGSMGEEEFRSAASRTKDKDTACTMHFMAMWNAEIQKRPTVARDHHRFMSRLGRDFCRSELALASMKYKR
jgi:hypothetical protein